MQVNLASEKHLSTNLPHPPVTETNNGFGVIPDPLPHTSHTANIHNCGGAKTTVSFFQNACYTGGNMQHAQSQITKPSGLRMPSPSLGFFGQVCNLVSNVWLIRLRGCLTQIIPSPFCVCFSAKGCIYEPRTEKFSTTESV